MPAGLFFENAAVVINGKIYAVTPWNVFEYDPRTNRWTDEKAVLTPFRHDFETAALNGKIYVVGGCTGGDQHVNTGAVDEYDPATHTWRSRAPMPSARMGLGVVAVSGKIYAIGGVNPITPVNAVEVYDPATNSWTKKRNWSRSNANTRAVQVTPGTIHVLSHGEEAGKRSPEVLEEYDLAKDTFRVLSSSERRDCAAATVVTGRLVTVGGHTKDANATVAIEAYNPAKNAWNMLADLPQARSCPAAVEVDGKLYVLGGAPVPWKDPMASVIVAETNDIMVRSSKPK
jgi:N-acetylneuraminic acid mutarotase